MTWSMTGTWPPPFAVIGCRENGNCPSNQACINGECKNPCMLVDPCRAPEVCRVQEHNSVCVNGTTPFVTCCYSAARNVPVVTYDVYISVHERGNST